MRTDTFGRRLNIALLTVILLASTGRSGLAQDVTVFAEGLTAPQGIEFDGQGRLWVAEQGSGSDDGRISVITSDGQVHPYLTGLPSNIVQGQPESAHHLLIRDGVLWASLGLGETDPDGFLLHADISGFVPGAPPLSMSDVEAEDVGTFILGVEFANDTGQTNIYNMAFGPGEDLYIVDASANAVVRRDSEGNLSAFAELPSFPNPSSVGPPTVQPVPTGIVFGNDRFFVSSFPGFPFPDGAARVFEIDMNGNVSLYRDGLTGAVDLVMGPDGSLVVLQFSRFTTFSNSFLPNTGAILKLTPEGTETLASQLGFPAGIRYGEDDDIYVSAFDSGQILKISATSTSSDPVEDVPEAFRLRQNYPNPFNPATTINYALREQGPVRLTVHSAMGQRVRTLVDAIQPAGDHRTVWDGKDDFGHDVASGAYLYRMQVDGAAETRMALLVR